MESEKIIKEDSYKDDLINILIKDSMNMSNSITNINNGIDKDINNINNNINNINNNINNINNNINNIVNTIAWWIPIKKMA
ncbi:hypothetical protein [Brachyspira murdochii]|uniref:hypothetical protein n=1 Tax=Brachyspira murdochii TaxID=84378 RepID=UPI0015E29AAE|nr:hypothetical protein [Brachyspira murdochii]